MARNGGPSDPARAAGENSFAAVVADHWNAVYRLLSHLTGNPHDTDDLAQETFLRALGRLDSFAPGTNMRAWLLRIASNAFFDGQRKRRRARVEPLADEPAAAPERPGKSLEIEEDCALLHAALEELSETARLVFHLRATEDMPFRDIAALLGTSEEAARWHMHQARTKLLKRLSAKL